MILMEWWVSFEENTDNDENNMLWIIDHAD